MISKHEWNALPYQVQQVWILGALGINPQSLNQPYLSKDEFVFILIQKKILSKEVVDHATGEIRKRSKIKQPTTSKH